MVAPFWGDVAFKRGHIDIVKLWSFVLLYNQLDRLESACFACVTRKPVMDLLAGTTFSACTCTRNILLSLIPEHLKYKDVEQIQTVLCISGS